MASLSTGAPASDATPARWPARRNTRYSSHRSRSSTRPSVCASCGHRTPIFGSGGGARLAEQLDAPLLAHVPLDEALRAAGDAGTPVVVRSAGAPAAVELARLAAVLPAPRRSLVGVALPLSVLR